MLDRLTESGPRRLSPRRAAFALASLAAHAAVVAAAVQATDAPPERPRPPYDVVLPPSVPTTVAPTPSAAGGPAGRRGPGAGRGVRASAAPPVLTPEAVPRVEELVPAPGGDATAALDGVLDLLVGGRGAGDVGDPLDFAGGRASTLGIEPPRPLSEVEPEYPAALRAAGVAGRVTIEFVVDTAGRVVAPSLAVVESAAPALAEPARRAVLATRFAPARLDGQPVAARVRRAIVFRITP